MRKKLFKGIAGGILAAVVLSALTGCGNAAKEAGNETAAVQSQESGTEAASAKEESASENVDRHGLSGQWEMVSYDTGSTVCMAEDMMMESGLYFYEDRGELCADYYLYGYFGQEDTNRMTVKEEAIPLYDGCPNQEWSAQLINKRDTDVERYVTLVGENELLYYEMYDDESLNMIYTYLRADSDELAHKAERRYQKTVTVSTVDELVEAVSSNTRIILKAGVYDFTEYSGYEINGVTSLLLEAEEGTEVVICTEMPYDPVLSFNTCSQIVLQGLTCGHEVEPGYCTGSVIYTEHSDNITINQCRLYGSGTYGVESYSSSGIYVTDTDIYDCSYGLVYLRETSFAEFRNCRFSNSREFYMFSILNCQEVLFENCEIRGNQTESEYYGFISGDDSINVRFRKCIFEGNTYNTLTKSDILFEECTIHDNLS